MKLCAWCIYICDGNTKLKQKLPSQHLKSSGVTPKCRHDQFSIYAITFHLNWDKAAIPLLAYTLRKP